MLKGQGTEIDKTMVELLGDPLVHLVRNSLDHGLEMPEVRESRGKPRKGTIRLEARQEGDQIVISIADDGAGIDPERVLRKAVEKGLVTAERGRQLTTREILDFIFLPGFSTVEKVSNLSGRGVGMDVVRSNLKRMNGSIQLESNVGKGTTVLLRLPLTLAILQVLLVQVSEEVYALPLRSVLETSRMCAKTRCIWWRGPRCYDSAIRCCRCSACGKCIGTQQTADVIHRRERGDADHWRETGRPDGGQAAWPGIDCDQASGVLSPQLRQHCRSHRGRRRACTTRAGSSRTASFCPNRSPKETAQ